MKRARERTQTRWEKRWDTIEQNSEEKHMIHVKLTVHGKVTRQIKKEQGELHANGKANRTHEENNE